MTDHLSHEGAHRLADRIRLYWRKRGWDVRPIVMSEPIKDGGRQVNAIRSDMLDGYPRRRISQVEPA